MKIIGAIFLLLTVGLLVNAVYAGATANWDVPNAMVTAHQSWDAFVAAVIPFIGGMACLFLGTMCCIYRRRK